MQGMILYVLILTLGVCLAARVGCVDAPAGSRQKALDKVLLAGLFFLLYLLRRFDFTTTSSSFLVSGRSLTTSWLGVDALMATVSFL